MEGIGTDAMVPALRASPTRAELEDRWEERLGGILEGRKLGVELIRRVY